MHRGYLSGAKAQVNMPELLISSGKAINVAVATENLGQGAKADQKADKILGQLAHAVLCAIMAWLLSVPGEGATDRSCTSSSHCMKLHKALSYSEECVVRTEQKLCYKMLLYIICCIPRGPLYSARVYEIAILYKCLHVKPIYVLLVETLVQQTFPLGFVEGQKR